MISFFSSKLNSSYEKLAFDFSFNDLDGSEIKLSEFKNKVLSAGIINGRNIWKNDLLNSINIIKKIKKNTR